MTQSRNIGSGRYYGAEVSLDARLADTLTVGGNYSRQVRDIADPTNAAFRPTGVPRDKAFLYALWTPLARVEITPSLELASNRWTANTAGTRWTRTGSYALAGLRADLTLTEGVSIGAGIMNAFDDNYALVDGFPEPGRRFFASMSARF
ncbi:TonB-dependent receptor domain-containing protein [Sphingobium sp. CR28]|uniref:TonB-dependent receptor domain-containing protein n=1 Tax=Sphingobium sp. CR28 TaxID=3400272 RepID=UPI003FF062D8